MSDERYKVVFRGEILPEKDIEEVKRNLMSLFKLSASKADAFFSGREVIIKKGLDYETALQYDNAFERAGVKSLIEPDSKDGKVGQVESSSSMNHEGRVTIISPDKVPGVDSCRPRPVPRITGWDEGININRMDLGHVHYNDLVLLSVFIDMDEADRMKFLIFVRGHERAFVTEADKINYVDFNGVKGETVVLSLKNFLVFLLRKSPAIIIDEATERFMRGEKPQTLEKGILAFATALSRELEKEEPDFYEEESKAVRPRKQEAMSTGQQDTSEKETPGASTIEKMVCPKCGMEQIKAEACRRCGVIIAKYLAREEELREEDTQQGPRGRERVLYMNFEGGVLSLFAMILLVYNPFLLPIGWALAFFASWVCANTTLSDEYSVRFLGRGEEIWWGPVMMVVPPALLGVIIAVFIPTMIFFGGQVSGGKIVFFLLLALGAILASLYYAYRILDWIMNSVEFSWGGRLFFNGPYWGFTGWIFSVVIVSGLVTLFFGWLGEMSHMAVPSAILLIISQAFIFGFFLFGLISWIFGRTTCSTHESLVWTGSVPDIAWRSLVIWLAPILFAVLLPYVHPALKLVLLVALIVCYAFLIHWYFRWLIQRIRIE